jgi:hypothetical protein
MLRERNLHVASYESDWGYGLFVHGGPTPGIR